MTLIHLKLKHKPTMKKNILLSGVTAILMMASCTSNAPQNKETAETVKDSLQITNPDLWAAQNHKLELKPDRGVMANPLELKKFIQIAIIVEDIEVAAREWAQILNVPVPEIRVHQTVDTTDPNLMYYVAMMYLLGVILSFINPYLYYNWLSLDAGAILSGQVWRLVTFLICPPSSGIFFNLIAMFLYYSLGTTLERTWGTFRFNMYFFMGVIGHIAAVFLIYGIFRVSWPVTTYYLNESLFLAFAVTFPEMVFYFFGLVPIKAKWFGAIIGVQFLMGQQKAARRYRTLVRLGAEHDTLCRAAKAQINWYFGLPVGVAAVSSLFGVRALFSGILSVSAQNGMTEMMIAAGAMILLLCVVEWLYMAAVKRSSSRYLLGLMAPEREE